MMFHLRKATKSDAGLLGSMNQQLIRDEGHRNPMTLPELQKRMRKWLAGEYAARLFECDGKVAGYALYLEETSRVYLRQFFVERPYRRRGFGRRAFQLLRAQAWPANKRLTVEVLDANEAALSFWKAVGFQPYSLTLELLPNSS